MAKYLIRRPNKPNGTYYVRWPIPTAARNAMGGRAEIQRSLKTSSKSEAMRKRWPVIANLQAEVNESMVAANNGPHSPEWFAHNLGELLARHQRGGFEDDPEHFYDQIDLLKEQHLNARSGGPHADVSKAVAKTLHKADGKYLLSEAVEDYLNGLDGFEAPKTIKGKRRTFEMLVEHLGDVPVDGIKPRHIVQFKNDVLQQNDRSVATIKKFLSEIASLWTKYLMPEAHVEYNPVGDLAKGLPKGKRGVEDPRRPWNHAELIQMVNHMREVKTDPDVLMGILIYVYTGMRKSELVDMKTDDVSEDALYVSEAKTKSGIRYIPLSPVIKPLIAKLKETAKDDYLLPTDRSRNDVPDAYGKTVIRRRREAGITDKRVVLHGLRSSYASALENAGVDESTRQILMGHSRGLSGVYSPANAVQFEILQNAVDKVTFGDFDDVAKKAVDALVASL